MLKMDCVDVFPAGCQDRTHWKIDTYIRWLDVTFCGVKGPYQGKVLEIAEDGSVDARSWGRKVCTRRQTFPESRNSNTHVEDV